MGPQIHFLVVEHLPLWGKQKQVETHGALLALEFHLRQFAVGLPA